LIAPSTLVGNGHALARLAREGSRHGFLWVLPAADAEAVLVWISAGPDFGANVEAVVVAFAAGLDVGADAEAVLIGLPPGLDRGADAQVLHRVHNAYT
jgi:hypothetical protein